MPDLFRVFPYLAGARADKPGGALYIPSQGGGRIDNPGTYPVLYLSDSPAGAIAEAFGRFAEWPPAVLEGIPALPGSVRALARYRMAEGGSVCNLDDPRQLLDLELRPSEVVSRDYTRSRSWALRIYQRKLWAGVRWWSYYDPVWTSFGLWDIGNLGLTEITPLRLDNPHLLTASRTIVRRIVA